MPTARATASSFHQLIPRIVPYVSASSVDGGGGGDDASGRIRTDVSEDATSSRLSLCVDRCFRIADKSASIFDRNCLARCDWSGDDAMFSRMLR